MANIWYFLDNSKSTFATLIDSFPLKFESISSKIKTPPSLFKNSCLEAKNASLRRLYSPELIFFNSTLPRFTTTSSQPKTSKSLFFIVKTTSLIYKSFKYEFIFSFIKISVAFLLSDIFLHKLFISFKAVLYCFSSSLFSKEIFSYSANSFNFISFWTSASSMLPYLFLSPAIFSMRSSKSSITTSSKSSNLSFCISNSALSSFIHSSKKELSFSIKLKASFTLPSLSNIADASSNAVSIFSFFEIDFFFCISSSSSPTSGLTSWILLISYLAKSFNSSTFFSLSSICDNFVNNFLYTLYFSSKSFKISTCKESFLAQIASRSSSNLTFSNSPSSFTLR